MNTVAIENLPRVLTPGLNALPPGTERYLVKAGGSVALTLDAGDEIELVNPEGLQAGEIGAEEHPPAEEIDGGEDDHHEHGGHVGPRHTAGESTRHVSRR